MTSAISSGRYTSEKTIGKIIKFLKSGGVAKLGKAVSDHDIRFGGDMDKTPGEYVVVVQLDGVNQTYWRATLLETLKSHVGISIDGTSVSLTQ